MSMHCVQYGRFRSHLAERFLQAKQSSVAPVAAVRLLRFLGPAADLVSIAGSSIGLIVVEAMVKLSSRCSYAQY